MAAHFAVLRSHGGSQKTRAWPAWLHHPHRRAPGEMHRRLGAVSSADGPYKRSYRTLHGLL